MERRHLFDHAVQAYDAVRPGYDAQLFEDIIEYAHIMPGQRIVEVGCGTGQATQPFLDRSCRITAIELGSRMASYTRKKFADYENLEIIHGKFEDCDSEPGRFDMLFSATAFHWIPPEVGYPKARRIIRSGGTLALFWNRPSVNNPEDPLHRRIQSLYDRFVPEWSLKGQKRDPGLAQQFANNLNEIEAYGFRDLKFKLYRSTRTVTGEQYTQLLSTYSDHRSLGEKIRNPFFHAIQETIEDCGNRLVIHDTVDLYLARNP